MSVKTLSSTATLAIVALFASPTQAGVIYNWVTLNNSPTIADTAGQIEITDRAYRAGRLDTELMNFGIGGSPFPDSPLIDFSFMVNGVALQITPRSPTGFDEFSLDAALRLNGSGPASGAITANNTESDIALGGAPIWAITRFGSDNPDADCFFPPGCSGAAGLWQIDRATLPVAEPSARLLFLGALAALAIARRKRSAA